MQPIDRPIWTENKARLIDLYLHYFVMITKHGTYIDGFAGRQHEGAAWAAELVLEREPRWLRHFHLFDLDEAQVQGLERLRKRQPDRDRTGRRLYRTINVYSGDFNVRVHELLRSGTISENEATFCLLDQRTFECHWSTVEALARHKAGNRIELFYFFPVRWLDRSLAAVRDLEKLRRWWGQDDLEALRSMNSQDRVHRLCQRFRDDLGYASSKPWPIFERCDGGPIMYYMVHATDHPDAPSLMSRAYRRAVSALVDEEQLSLF